MENGPNKYIYKKLVHCSTNGHSVGGRSAGVSNQGTRSKSGLKIFTYLIIRLVAKLILGSQL